MTIDRFVDPPEDDDFGDGFLASRTALVTGAARRVGRELVLALAAEGAHVVVHCHTSQEEGRALVREIIAGGGAADLVVGDLADAKVAASLCAEAVRLCGNPLDILINNAAVFERCEAGETSVEQWDEMQVVNLRAPFLLAQGFVAQLPAKWRGDIINLNDARALGGDPEHFAYGISKVGLHGLTQSLARALAPRIAVNELGLGAVMSPANGDYIRTKKTELPLGRFPQLGDVVSGLMFLLSTEGVTGQTIRLDGGQYPE